jgi:hypothetical protein
MNKELQNYIKLSREAGLSDEQIKQELLESKVGWTEEDINQAFKLDTSSISSQTSKPKSFWKYVLILGIVVVLGAGASFGYYHFYVHLNGNNEEETSENNEEETSENNEEETSENNEEEIPVSETPSNEVEDCGVTEFFIKHDEDFFQSLQTESTLEELNQDNVMVCLGDNILNDCRKSEAIFKTADMGDIKFIVEGSEKEDICNIKTEYGDAKQIQSEEQKQWANSYISCPVNINDLLKEAIEAGRETEEIVGGIPIVAYVYLGVASFDPEEANCTTNQIPVVPF